MTLKEIKNNFQHYYVNDAGQRHGEYKRYWNNGQLEYHCHFNNGKYHGEYKRYYKNGQLWIHTYDVNAGEVHDFMKEDSELIRVCLYMTHGAPFLGGSDAT